MEDLNNETQKGSEKQMSKKEILTIISIILIISLCVVIGIIIKRQTSSQMLIGGIKTINDAVNVIPIGNVTDEQIAITGNSETLIDSDINPANSTSIANDAEVIIIGTVKSIDGTVNYNPVAETYVFPRTVGQVTVNKVIKGNLNYNEIPFMKSGGILPVSEYEKSLRESEISKMGLDKISEEEKKTTYVKEVMSDDIEIQEGKTYLMYLKYNQDYGCYIISYQKYGLREVDTNIESSNQAILNSNTRTIQSSEYSTIKVKDNENGKWVTLDSLIPSQYKK